MMAITGKVHQAPLRDYRSTVSRIRGLIVQSLTLEMPNTTLQTFMLCHVHDTWFGDSDTQAIAQCMWPIMVTHSRKKGIGVAGPIHAGDLAEQEWTAWARDEGKSTA
jgi:hypothetical protein